MTKPADWKQQRSRPAGGSDAGVADDLTMMSGIGQKLEQVPYGKGSSRLADFARWTASDGKRIWPNSASTGGLPAMLGGAGKLAKAWS